MPTFPRTTSSRTPPEDGTRAASVGPDSTASGLSHSQVNEHPFFAPRPRRVSVDGWLSGEMVQHRSAPWKDMGAGRAVVGGDSPAIKPQPVFKPGRSGVEPSPRERLSDAMSWRRPLRRLAIIAGLILTLLLLVTFPPEKDAPVWLGEIGARP